VVDMGNYRKITDVLGTHRRTINNSKRASKPHLFGLFWTLLRGLRGSFVFFVLKIDLNTKGAKKAQSTQRNGPIYTTITLP
jgi:hypothetical protein